jgi:hypothetical protein
VTTLTICVSFCVPALFQHCVSASVFAFVLQQFAFVFSICVRICVAAFVLQHLCFSFCVPASVLHKQSIAINDNLDHLRHLCCSHISNNSALAPTLRLRMIASSSLWLLKYVSNSSYSITTTTSFETESGSITDTEYISFYFMELMLSFIIVMSP